MGRGRSIVPGTEPSPPTSEDAIRWRTARARCATCAAVVTTRGARWCGSCGAALVPSVPSTSTVPGGGHQAARRWPVVAVVAAVGFASLASLAVIAWPSLPNAHERGSLALDLPARAEIATPAPSGGDAGGSDPGADGEDGGGAGGGEDLRPVAEPSGEHDLATSGDGTVPTRCLDGVACRVWQVDLPAGTEPGSIVTGEGVVVVPSVRELRTYDARTGALRWSVSVRSPGNRVVAPRAGLAGGLVLVAGTGERLHAYGRDDGERRWSATVPGLEQVDEASEVDGQLLVVVGRAGQRARPSSILALDPADGALRWQLDVDGAILTDAGPVSTDRLGGVRAHQPQDGGVRWSAQHHGAVGEVRAAGSLVLIAAAEERLLLDGVTGAQVARLPRVAMIGPLPTEDATVVPGEDRALLVDGDGIVWDVAVAGGCCTGHLVGGEEVVVRTTDGRVLVLDRADGALLEERGSFDPDRDEVPGWLLGGLEFSAVSDEVGAELRLRVRDVRSGRLLEELPAVSPVAVLGSDVIVASYDRMLRLTPSPSRFGPTASLLTQ
jgi:outer membrane protein assembly factor BamB